MIGVQLTDKTGLSPCVSPHASLVVFFSFSSVVAVRAGDRPADFFLRTFNCAGDIVFSIPRSSRSRCPIQWGLSSALAVSSNRGARDLWYSIFCYILPPLEYT